MRDIEIGTAQRPCLGEQVCGDAYVVAREDGITTIAIADGLGHGPEAALASNAFCDFARDNSQASLEEIMRGSHREMSSTRGAAAALLRIDGHAQQLEFTGIGNIEVHACGGGSIHPVCVPGIVGRSIRKLMPFRYELNGGALVALFSDGISSRFSIASYGDLDPQAIADAILEEHGKNHDDATCIVVKC